MWNLLCWYAAVTGSIDLALIALLIMHLTVPTLLYDLWCMLIGILFAGVSVEFCCELCCMNPRNAGDRMVFHHMAFQSMVFWVLVFYLWIGWMEGVVDTQIYGTDRTAIGSYLRSEVPY